MGKLLTPYQFFSLGDTAITINFGNTIDEEINKQVIARYHQLQVNPLPGMLEAVPAYSSLTIYYDVCSLTKKIEPGKTVYDWMKEQVQQWLIEEVATEEKESRNIKIPVCYEDEFATDIRYLANTKNISVEDVIQLHTSKKYKVYMLGFLPGFSYMGEVDEKIEMPRKPQPVSVKAGSIGIAGKQTGIYPLSSPGGWQIIGRTPLKLFDVDQEDPTLIKLGDTVQFYSITKKEFNNLITIGQPTS
jgi:inhibitor of KinA